MLIKKNLVLIFVFLIFYAADSYCQNKTYIYDFDSKLSFNNKKNTGKSDSVTSKLNKKSSEKTYFGGIFLSPSIGISYPVGTFRDYSKSGLIYGIKAEIGLSRLYPFVFGFVYEYQKNNGDADYITTNFLTYYDTKITYIGGSVDFILSKYIKTSFTMPVLSAEIKYASIVKEIGAENSTAIVPINESTMTYSAGLAFTLYVFDIYSRYTFAGDYSNLTLLFRMHIPLVKF